jgi:hypothetical protein
VSDAPTSASAVERVRELLEQVNEALAASYRGDVLKPVLKMA